LPARAQQSIAVFPLILRPPRGSGLGKQRQGGLDILFGAHPVIQVLRQPVLRRKMPLIGGFRQPLDRQGVVLQHPVAMPVLHRQLELSACLSGLSLLHKLRVLRRNGGRLQRHEPGQNCPKIPFSQHAHRP
jgi:hypothetical protein